MLEQVLLRYQVSIIASHWYFCEVAHLELAAIVLRDSNVIIMTTDPIRLYRFCFFL